MQEFKVEAEAAGGRVDIFVARRYPQFARSALAGLFKTGLVNINGNQAKAGDKLRKGDSVTVDESLILAEPEAIDLPILYEDDDVVVINKPAGVLTHSKGALNSEATVASFIKPKLTDKKMADNRAGIVHRLDRGTSGVIIVARNTEALASLQKQFSLRKVKKQYLTIVEGWPHPTAAKIDAPIERNPWRLQTFRVGSGGKTAQTTYETLRRFTKQSKKYAELMLKPLTGRTHQLRVHLAYIGHPVAGDGVYGHAHKGMLLHATQLEITLPSGHRRVFKAPLPSTFRDFKKP